MSIVLAPASRYMLVNWRDEHFIASIVFWTNCWSSLCFFGRVRNTSECFSQWAKENLPGRMSSILSAGPSWNGQEKRHGL